MANAGRVGTGTDEPLTACWRRRRSILVMEELAPRRESTHRRTLVPQENAR